jgi:hypothetical protein
MLMTYGRGRAEQFRLHPTLGSALNFVPPLFCVYLLLLPLAVWWTWMLLPLVLYSLVVLVQVIVLIPRGGLWAGATLPLIVATHIFYGLGFWKGLFTCPLAKAKGGTQEVTLETISAGEGEAA